MTRTAFLLLLAVAACARYDTGSPSATNAALDSLNARVVQAYRDHDPAAYGALYTDSAIFEWPAFNSVRGRAGMVAMARGNWASLTDMDLRLTVASRRFGDEHATEFGAFEQSWRDSSGGRNTEYGRYVQVTARQPDGRWLIDRFFGFSDSTRATPVNAAKAPAR
ncbi:MAG TPA: nuclear transport factor 2 family protein [Gemmatimonadaceae bacterium]|nr:nuclear transport factor 2 family protein [Gemmatimonadaceae bacterium]